jgi:cytochrome b subunit of formate dehydrogenase
MDRATARGGWEYGHLGAAVALGIALAAAAHGQDSPNEAKNRRCLNCHGQRRIVTISDEERGAMVSSPPAKPRRDPNALLVDPERFGRSVHARLACQDCHPGPADLPHAPKLPPPKCAGCHATQAELYMRGIHAEALAEGRSDAPHCWDCHGGHDVLPPTTRESRTYPLNIVTVCSGCHERHADSPSVQVTGKDLVLRFLDSVHGRAVLEAGLTVAAVCPDCHRAHEIRPSREPESSVHRNHVPGTCGRCHVGVAEVYADSIHSRLRHQGAEGERVPVCTSCHTAHRIARVETPSFSRDIVEECGECHANLYATYRESYHGQVNRLGYRRAARCSDCHGAHDVRPVGDPRSRLSAANKLPTCQSCHQGAPPKFAQFMPHADYRDRQSQPLLYAVWLYFMILMSGTFGCFGLHSICWWIRSVVEHVRLKRQALDMPAACQGQGHTPPTAGTEPGRYMRFCRADRVTHALVITSFMGLTITGLPLKFSDQPWALLLADALGGGNIAGILHRMFATIMLLYVFIHLVRVAGWARAQLKSGRRAWLFGPDSLLPRLKDLWDLRDMLKWFFGRGPFPRFDRWTYWEKFDYLADAAGTVIIGGSGLVLAFPLVASYFLPGWLFNVAMIIHGYEALLAIGFIFTIHFFNAHLRLEKFPADTVIFTGQISQAEMRHERPLQYERLQATGTLAEWAAPAKPHWRHVAATVVGTVLLLIGLTLIVLIIWAGLTSARG